MERKAYLDHLRCGTVWLVVLYHVIYIYNSVGVLGGVGSFSEQQPIDALLYAVYPWFMVLLFLVAGICSRYALQQRTPKEFLRERTRKLLVPSTLGLFLYHWMSGYLNIALGGAFDLMPSFMRYPISVLSGVGPMWFCHTLWLLSLLLLLVRKIDRNDRFYTLCGKLPIWDLLLLCLPIWGASYLLNVPVITVYRFGIYGLAYLLGYFVFSHEAVQKRIQAAWKYLAIAAVLLCVGYVWTFFGENYTEPACLTHPFTNFYLWIVILALLGCAMTFWSRPTTRTKLLAHNNFAIYVLHYLPLLATAYLLKVKLELPALPCYLLTLLATVILTPFLAEILTRIPLVRWLLFGLQGKRRSQTESASPSNS